MTTVRTANRCLLLLVLLLGPVIAIAGRADSLQTLLAKSGRDTTRVKLLLTIANQYEQVNGDSVAKYSRQAYDLSREMSYNAGIADALEMIGAAYFITGSHDTALSYYNRSLEYGKKYKLNRSLASKYNHIGNMHFITNRYADATIYYDSAITSADKYANPEIKGKASSNLANVYYKMGNYSRALPLYLQGLKIQEQLGNALNTSSDLANLANVYYRLGMHDKALDYNERTLAINKRLKIKEREIGAYTLYAMIYSDKKKHDSSQLYLEKALTLATEMQSPYLQNILIGNLAENYLKKGDLAKALELYNRSLAMSAKLGDEEGIAIAKSGLGQVLLAQGSAAAGRAQLKEAFGIMQRIGIKEQALDIASRLSASYAASGEFKEAYYFLSQKTDLADTLKKQKSKQEVEQLVFNYELQKKEQQIKLLETDNALQQQKNRNQQMLICMSLIAVVLIGIVAYTIYRNSIAVKKNRQVILQQKEVLTAQAAKLAELNDFKDATFSLLAHDLRSPVNALAGSMLMFEQKAINPEDFTVYQQELNNKLQAVTILIDNMLYWAQNQMKGEFTLNIEKISLKKKVLRALSVLNTAAQQKDIQIVDNVADDIYATADKDHVDIVIRNLVSNAIKFTRNGGTITIGAEQRSTGAAITIADTGVGMTPQQIAELLTDKTQISTKGTEGEKGTGLGLRLCYQLVQKNNGELQVSSIPGKGTTFTILLPSA